MARKLSDRRKAILKYLWKHPGGNSTQIAEHFGMAPGCITSRLQQMWAAGLVERRWKSGPVGLRGYAYWVVNEATQPEEQPVEEQPVDLPADTGEVEALRARVAELETWKAWAIAKHADLKPVDPLLLKARQIAADYTMAADNHDPVTVAELRDGTRDHAPIIQIALAALRSQQEA